MTPEHPPYDPGSDTSFDAAQSMKATAAERREQAFEYVLRCGAYGSTMDEMLVATGMSHQTGTPRMWELAGANAKNPWPVRIVRTRTTRRTRTGRMAHVYVALAFLEDDDAAAELASIPSPPTGSPAQGQLWS